MSSTQNVLFHFQHMQWEAYMLESHTNLTQLFFSTPLSCGKFWTFFNTQWLEIGKFSCPYNKSELQNTCASIKALYPEEGCKNQVTWGIWDWRFIDRHTARLFCISQWFVISFERDGVEIRCLLRNGLLLEIEYGLKRDDSYLIEGRQRGTWSDQVHWNPQLMSKDRKLTWFFQGNSMSCLQNREMDPLPSTVDVSLSRI